MHPHGLILADRHQRSRICEQNAGDLSTMSLEPIEQLTVPIPQGDGVVITARDDGLPVWTKTDTPNHTGVAQNLELISRQAPQSYRVVIAGGSESLSIAAELHVVNFILMPGQLQKRGVLFIQGAQSNGLIPTG